MIAGAVSVAVLVAMTTVDLSTGAGVSSMLQFSVRLAVPWLYIAFAAWGARMAAWARQRLPAPAT